MDRYSKHNGQGWARPVRRNFKMSCCDCCLVHVMDFRVRDGSAEFRMKRDNRATMNKRRHTPIVARKTVAAQLRAMRKSSAQRGPDHD